MRPGAQSKDGGRRTDATKTVSEGIDRGDKCTGVGVPTMQCACPGKATPQPRKIIPWRRVLGDVLYGPRRRRRVHSPRIDRERAHKREGAVSRASARSRLLIYVRRNIPGASCRSALRGDGLSDVTSRRGAVRNAHDARSVRAVCGAQALYNFI